VHNAKNVWFKDVEFDANLRCDDMIHADRADVNIVGCTFRDANGDSIDYDMSTGLIRDCEIERSGNDGLDLMTCWPRVVHNHIVGSADKGISVGEASAPLVFDNLIEKCERGIEAKDASQPLVIHDMIRDNQVGVRERLKNWRYDYGGWAKILNTVLQGNRNALELQQRTHLTLAGAELGAPSDAVTRPVDANWLLVQFGIRAASDRLGPLDSFELGAAIAPIVEVGFDDDFELPTDGWIHDRGVHLLEKRVEDLVATFRRDRGSFGARVDWNLDDPSQRYLLILEIGSQGMTSLAATVESDRGNQQATIAPQSDATRYQFAVIPLPPARYGALILHGEPDANVKFALTQAPAQPANTASRVFLHGYRVMALPLDEANRR
jgi:hypothetical protein